MEEPPPPAVPVQTVPPRAAGLQAAPAGEGGAQEPGVRRGRRGGVKRPFEFPIRRSQALCLCIPPSLCLCVSAPIL